MSIEHAYLAQARPHMLAAKAQEILRNEVSKGCRPDINPHPVALEPPYQPVFGVENINSDINAPPAILETPAPKEKLVRFQVWISPEQKCNWNRSELFIKQLSYSGNRIALEIIGNQDQIDKKYHQKNNNFILRAVLFSFHFFPVLTINNYGRLFSADPDFPGSSLCLSPHWSEDPLP